GDLSTLGGSVLQTIPPRLHFPNAALKSAGERLVGEGGPNDGAEDFMQVGEPLDGISEGLLVNLRVLLANAVTDCAVGRGGKAEIHDTTPTLLLNGPIGSN